jgi:hypothetical protein
MKFELKSIGYWSVIKISFVINLVVGACIGLFVGTFLGVIMSFASQFGGMGGTEFPMFEDGGPTGIIMIIVMVFVYGFMGAVFNTILAIVITFVYNMAARLLGGFELELEQTQLQPVMPNAYPGQQPQYQQPPSYAQPQPQPQAPQPPQPPRQQTPAPPPPPPPVQPLPPDITPPEGDTDKDNPPA